MRAVEQRVYFTQWDDPGMKGLSFLVLCVCVLMLTFWFGDGGTLHALHRVPALRKEWILYLISSVPIFSEA